MSKSPKPPSSKNSKTLFGRLWRQYLRKRRYWIMLAALCMMIEGGTLSALARMLEPMFDEVFQNKRSDLIWFVGLGIFGLFTIRAITGITHRVILTKVNLEASSEIQIDLLKHSMVLDGTFHSKTSPGSLIERVQGDVMAIQNLWSAILTGAARDLISLIFLLGVAISIDWKWTLFAAVGTPLLLLPSMAVQRYIRRKSGLLREIAGKRTTRLDEIFHGINPIKLNRMESYQSKRFEDLSAIWVNSTVKTTAGQATVPALVDIAVGLGFFCVLVYGGPQIIAGQKTIGEFMSFFTAMSLAFQPLRRLGGVAGYWQMMQVSLGRIFTLLDTMPAVRELPKSETQMPAGSHIEFKGVNLAFDDHSVLRDLSFDAVEGKTTALVGQSGAGKSTIFNALTRLIDPQSGEISIGDVRTNELPIGDLRSLFSVVSQEALLFDETLRENIVLGREDVDEATLTGILEAAHVMEFLKTLPEGLETPVGPRGSNLSGGQRQRVAIARALLRNTPILLLDEATSALDTESETLVQQALDGLSEGRTTLVIAHRLSTIRNADKIVVMDQGRVAEVGTHEDLIAKQSIYARLHDLQFKDPI